MTATKIAVVDTAAHVGAPHRFDILRRLLRNRRSQVGLLILVPIVALTVLEPILPLQSPTKSSLTERFISPTWGHPFGTDSLGRDGLARTISGGRISLLVGVAVGLASVSIGIVVGTFTAYYGRWVDSAISGVINVLLSFPGLLIGVTVLAMFGPGVGQVILAATLAFAPRAIRLQRSFVLGVKTNPYMDAARMVAAPTWWILLRHIIPNTLSPMLVIGAIYTASAILIEATMSYLGLGIIPPTASWGSVIREGEPHLRDAWWISMIPAVLLMTVAIGFHFVADGARQVLDPTEHDRGA